MDNRSENSAVISLAFRFHVNFYHSYRGDTPDEKGFGKDIRIIRHVLDTLDRLNGGGVPIRAAWDIENYFSLERIMPQYCPDLIRRIQKRVADGRDEVELMSYNNGMLSAHTREEFDTVVQSTVSNSGGSGVKDLFERYVPIVRPQECMYTPSFLKLYPEHGIHVISLFYSCHPFNGFSNFVKPLPFLERYNPLWLEAPGAPGRMTLLPCYNNGDIVDHISLKRWLAAMRRTQLKTENPSDLLLLIDMDADDEFWTGYDIPVAKQLLTVAQGLEKIVRSVALLSYLRFDTPGDYLNAHRPVGTVLIGQDTADGSFDGYSSWAEKWQNKTLWTAIERSRYYAGLARSLGSGNVPEAEENLRTALHSRVLALSTTHFGMSSPVMNADRLKKGEDLAERAVKASKQGLEQALGTVSEPGLALIFPADVVAGKGLARIPADAFELAPPAFRDGEDGLHRAFERTVFGLRELCFAVEPGQSPLPVSPADNPPHVENPVRIGEDFMENGSISLRFGPGAPEILWNGRSVTAKGFPRCALTYGGKLLPAIPVLSQKPTLLGGGEAAVCELRATVRLPNDGSEALWHCQLTLVRSLPYLYADVEWLLPRTDDHGFNRAKAIRLAREWDARWQEVMPLELRLAFEATDEKPYTVWKRNYFGDVSSYTLNYGTYSRNKSLDSFNNQITADWVAVSNGEKGVLLSQTVASNMSAAFCPMRLEESGGVSCLSLNPFGTYSGKQWRYPTAHTGLGRTVALAMADHLDSYAPSYNGETVRFSLMIAPFDGDRPPEQACADAAMHAWPPCVLRGGRFSL
jgi:hypothetical protein